MTPEVVQGRPPNFDQIEAVFPHASRTGVIFAWGGIIYKTGFRPLPPQLMAHEIVHCERQGDDPWPWWEKYLADVDFRREEEILAHIAELRCLVEGGASRPLRRRATMHVAKRLSSPLYNGMISLAEARKVLAEAVK